MKKVDIITFGNLDVKTGVNKVIENLYLGKEFFRKDGIEINNIIGFNEQKNSVDKRKKQEIYSKGKEYLKKFFEFSSKKSQICTFFAIYLKYIVRAKLTIKKYLKLKKKGDVVLFHDLFSCSEYLKKIKEKNQKIILVLHTNGETFKQIEMYYPNQDKRTKKYMLNLEQEVLRKVDKIVFVSQKSANIFLVRHKEYISKVVCIYNGIIDLPEREKINKTFEENPLKFICVGTLNGRKGQELILNVVKKLETILKGRVIFIIVGGGPMYKKYKQLVEKMKLETIIKVLGNRNDVKDLLSKSQVFILPSFDEGLPIAIIEAMRSGLPIISTNVGGIPEMIENEKEGYLIEPKEKEIEKIILKILNNRNILIKMSRFSRKKYEETFSLKEMIKKYGDIINE